MPLERRWIARGPITTSVRRLWSVAARIIPSLDAAFESVQRRFSNPARPVKALYTAVTREGLGVLNSTTNWVNEAQTESSFRA